jgi:hypothetical protein
MKLKEIFISFVFSIYLTGIHGQIPTTILLTIENGVTDVIAFDFKLEKEEMTFCHFKFDQFEQQHENGIYANTNLYAYTNRDDVKYGNYMIKIKIIFADTIVFYEYPLNFSKRTDGAFLTTHVGKSLENNTYLKDLTICLSTIANKDSMFLKILDIPRIDDSPRFEIVNLRGNKLYPYNENGHFFGHLYKKDKKGEWATHSYFQPYQVFDCIDSVNTDTIIVYATTTSDCSKTRIDSEGTYKFRTEVATAPKYEGVPSSYLKKGVTRVRVFQSFDLEYDFKIKR